MEYHVNVPMDKDTIKKLKYGDMVYLTGKIYTARDAAHKRMAETLERGEKLPFDVKGNIIYYMGPSPAREGHPIGSAGPTTASRMDKVCLTFFIIIPLYLLKNKYFWLILIIFLWF